MSVSVKGVTLFRRWGPVRRRGTLRPDPKLGPRHVEVETMYNTERYRPTYDHKETLPIFLTKS